MTANDDSTSRIRSGPPLWWVRPSLWFATALLGTTLLHELAHALTARALGVNVRLFSYIADLDWAPGQASVAARALIALAGPGLCLLLGALSGLAYRLGRPSLPLLYLTVFGLGTVFGNMLSAAAVGDFATAATALGLPMGARVASAVVGLLALVGLHIWAGRALISRVPPSVGRAEAAIGVIVVPAVFGTLAAMLAQSPLPPPFQGARIAESSLWVFALVGAATSRLRSAEQSRTLALRRADVATAIVVFIAARLLAGGVSMAD